jgi:hypothetical protein
VPVVDDGESRNDAFGRNQQMAVRLEGESTETWKLDLCEGSWALFLTSKAMISSAAGFESRRSPFAAARPTSSRKASWVWMLPTIF